jgi:TldD protein
MRDEMTAALKGHKADYVELRLEELEGSHISYRGRDLEDIGRSTSKGGCARAFVNGAWGFVTFTRADSLREKVELAVRQARLASGEGGRLSRGQPVERVVPPVLVHDPFKVPLDKKVGLLEEYVEALWSVPGLQSTSLGYGDRRRRTFFANSEGSYIQQERVDVTFRARTIARKDGDVQQYGISVGSLGDYRMLEGRHDEMREVSQRAVDLLAAPQIQGGEYTVVCDPILAGVFAHEAVGHLSEADFVYENDRLKEVMVLGRRFGGKHLNIVDGAAIPDLRGSYEFDDEGMPARRTDLIREGVLVGRLHSRETAAKMGETATGNARAIDYRFSPIVRMTNTIIEPGEATVEELIADVKDGVYAKNWYGGMTSMEMFTFSAGEAYRIRNGRIEELLRPVVLSGNVFTTLENLDAVANDLDINQGGGCGKGGQSPLPVANGSPHMRIQKCLVGGA